jgi:Arc/MetJ-type ribon-helix-helix transcriptional regulator
MPLRIPFRIPGWYTAGMATEQIAVRLPEPLLSGLDDLVTSGAYESRASAVRAGIEAIMKLEHQRQTDQAVVDGYTRHPPTETEEHAALASLREAILDEPW